MNIPVFCSLLPTELFISLGHEVHFVSAEELTGCNPQEYHCAFHENLCSYSKSLYDYFLGNHEQFGIIIIPTACDALKKLYNSLKAVIPAEKLYMLDIPQIKGDAAATFLAKEFELLTKKIGNNSRGNEVPIPAKECHCDPELVEGEAIQRNTMNPLDRHVGQWPPRDDMQGEKIGILGSNVPLKVIESSLSKFGFGPVYLNHCLTKAYPDSELLKTTGDLKEYAKLFMGKNTCPRTHDHAYRERLKERIEEEKIKGLIFNSIKFCDFHPFDFRYFNKEMDIPSLIIEHELTANYEGQLMTRIEAFLEGLKGRLKKDTGLPRRSTPRNDKSALFYVGIDSGSHATKLVCIDKDKKVIFKDVCPTGTSVKKSVEDVLKNLYKSGVKKEDVGRIIGTGYGRSNITMADDIITEISCHAAGAHHILGKAATIIDIGGQDSKAIKIDDQGNVSQFAMNDKCAAGTGRFLEVMANKLQMSLEEFAELAHNSNKTVPISSMCSVFAESEVISLIASGKSKEEISRGIHRAIAERTVSLSKRIKGEPPYYMAGGVAKNKGLVKELEDCLDSKMTVINEPQFTGALGAALFAMKS